MQTRLAVLLTGAALLLLPAAGASAGAGDTGAAPPAAVTADSIEKEAFESAKELNTVEAWDAFLEANPSGHYAELARENLRKLKEKGAN